jgi:hypothetical protein
MSQLIADDRTPSPARTALIPGNDPRLELLAVHDNRVWEICVGFAAVEDVCISCCGFCAGKLDRQCRLILLVELRSCRIEKDSPIVDVLVVWLGAITVGIAAEDGPVNVVEGGGGVVDADAVRYAGRKVGRKVVGAPVDAVLVWMERVREVGVWCVAVEVLYR